MHVTGVVIPGERCAELQTHSVNDPSGDFVVVRIVGCGICTWEQRVFRGVKRTYPFWGGHEVCGRVERYSPGLICDFRPGDFVALALLRRCGTCQLCRDGLDNHCVYANPDNVSSLPLGPRGLSDRIAVRSYQVIPLKGLDISLGTMIEPLACVLRSVRRAGITIGTATIVIGNGTLGLLHAAVLRVLGASVLLIDCESNPADTLEQLQTNGFAQASCVFCTRGGTPWIEAAVKMTSRGGRVLLFQSVRGDDTVRLGANDLHYREIAVLGSISQRLEDFSEAAKLALEHPELFSDLKTLTMPCDRPTEAFQASIDPSINRVIVAF